LNFLNKILSILDNKTKKKIIFFVLLSILIVFFELLSLGMIIPIVSAILDPQTILKYLEILPIKISYINLNNLIIAMLVLFNILIIIKNVLLFFAQKYQAYFVANFQHDLQIKLFKHYLYQPIINLMRNNIAIIHRNIIVITESFSHTVLGPALNIISDLIILIILLSVLIFAEPFVTIVGLFASAIVAFGIFFINKKNLLENGERSKINQSSRIKNFNETFGAILEIKSLNKENLFIKKFEDNTNILRNVQKKLSVLSFFPKLFFEVFGVLLISLFLYVLIQRTDNLNATLSVVVLFAYIIIKIIPIVNKILINFQRIRFSRPIMNEIYHTIKEVIIEKKIKNIEKLLQFENKIDLVDIGFFYNKNIHILKKINLTIKKNTFVAIGGDSGSGKSTLLKLILGLLKPTSGEIFVDNKPISSSPKKWQENICFVPQDIFILDDSLQNNITLEVSSDVVNFTKLHSVIDLSDLRNFTNSLPLGLSTILGDRGSRISGGQKQRIGIARALYANSEIVILDESTSSIEEISELKIYENLKKLKNKTIIFVTHKKSITKYCDEFYIFEDNTFKKIINENFI
jgi:ABC-type bacteriocin/lantibiotic exporter with double-glycine peptidase domain